MREVGVKCPYCGYANLEGNDVCFQCGERIRVDRTAVRSEFDQTPRQTGKDKHRLYTRVSPRIMWLIGLLTVSVSTLLPWVSCQIKDAESGALVYSWDMSLIDLVATVDPLIVALTILLFAGILAWVIYPKCIWLSVIALALMFFTNSKYIRTHVPIQLNPEMDFWILSFPTFGYVLALIVVVILALLAVKNIEIDEAKVKERWGRHIGNP